jgi:hypothetical protein
MQKIILILLVLISIVPQALQSQVSGPTNPDFMKFTPALENTGSVNEFDGSFSFQYQYYQFQVAVILAIQSP